LGSDPKVVSSLVKEIVTGMQEQGVSSTLKHFPGHGEASEDSHKGAVNVESDLNRLRDVDFLPFRAGIKAGADFIMVSHISISRVTEDTVPSSLSSLVMKDILRKELGFKGIIITDALNMKAITNDYSAGDAAVASVQAGTDMLLMPEDLEQAYFAVFNAVLNGTITEEQINQSVTRILETKIRRGIILSNTNLINKKNVTD
jgi:Beta-glucosidase-related glycosidases